MKLSINKLNQAFEAASYGDPCHKELISKMGKAALRRVAKALELEKGQYRLDYNPGGIAVPGEVTLHTEFVYVQIQAKFFGTGAQVMYRACESQKDYCGRTNYFVSAKLLESPEQMAKCLTDIALREGTLATVA